MLLGQLENDALDMAEIIESLPPSIRRNLDGLKLWRNAVDARGEGYPDLRYAKAVLDYAKQEGLV